MWPDQIWEPDLTVLCTSAQALSTDSVERLPVFNKSALRHYKLSLEADDWCVPSKEPLNLANYRAQKWFGHKNYLTFWRESHPGPLLRTI